MVPAGTGGGRVGEGEKAERGRASAKYRGRKEKVGWRRKGVGKAMRLSL